MFLDFLHGIKGSVDEIDCMIEAKKKDDALFRLVADLEGADGIEWVDKGSFVLK